MSLLLVLVTLFGPHPQLLGDEDWIVREKETARCDNVLMALLLPSHDHQNPEIDARLNYLRTRNLKLINSWYVEQLEYNSDFRTWVRWYLAKNRTRYKLQSIWNDLNVSKTSRWELFNELPLTNEITEEDIFSYDEDTSGKLKSFQEYLNYYWQIAPYPKEVHK